MWRLASIAALNLSAALALAQAPASGDETPAADSGTQETEFKPPLGFVAKKRGALVLYCKKDTTIGTRFKTEMCYSEAQMRDYMVAQQENKRDIDRIRNTCSTGAGEFCRRP